MTIQDLDYSLFCSVSAGNTSEKHIRDLIKKGANINAIDSCGNSILIEAIRNVNDGLDLKYIKLIIDLGANLDYLDEGFNCLFDACLTCNTELVELLLKAGANPNCVSTDIAESLLDWATFDMYFQKDHHEKSAMQMIKIVRILKKYGAKPLSEIFADKPEQFLNIFATYDTGLYTAKGYLKIDDIHNANDNLIEEFKSWVAANPDKWSEYKYDKAKIINPPDLKILKVHNKQGLLLAKKNKKLVGKDIKVKYYFVIPYGFKKHNIRNVKKLLIL